MVVQDRTVQLVAFRGGSREPHSVVECGVFVGSSRIDVGGYFSRNHLLRDERFRSEVRFLVRRNLVVSREVVIDDGPVPKLRMGDGSLRSMRSFVNEFLDEGIRGEET